MPRREQCLKKLLFEVVHASAAWQLAELGEVVACVVTHISWLDLFFSLILVYCLLLEVVQLSIVITAMMSVFQSWQQQFPLIGKFALARVCLLLLSPCATTVYSSSSPLEAARRRFRSVSNDMTTNCMSSG
jgi:hypothetical protein